MTRFLGLLGAVFTRSFLGMSVLSIFIEAILCLPLVDGDQRQIEVADPHQHAV